MPISLYISIEFVKIIHAFLISQDLKMWYEPEKSGCIPRSWNLSDDLGQIEYVFSDKTGTLTQNVMEFRKCSIAGKQYGESEQNEETINRFLSQMKKTFEPVYATTNPEKLTFADWQIFEDLRDVSNSPIEPRDSQTLFSKKRMSDLTMRTSKSSIAEISASSPNYPRSITSFADSEMERDVNSISDYEKPGLSQSEAISEFFMLLALCHTVTINFLFFIRFRCCLGDCGTA